MNTLEVSLFHEIALYKSSFN